MQKLAVLCLATAVLVCGVAAAVPVVETSTQFGGYVDADGYAGPPSGPPGDESPGGGGPVAQFDDGILNLTDVPTPDPPEIPPLSTPTPTPTPTPSPTPTSTETPAPTPTSTETPALTPTATETPTATPEPTPTDTETPAPTSTPESTPTDTPEPTPTTTTEQAPTETPEPTPTDESAATQTPTSVVAGGEPAHDETPTPTAEPTAMPAEGSVDVVEATTTADWVRAGYSTAVRATVENMGEESETVELTVTLDDRPVETREVTVDGGESTTVVFDLVPEATDGGTVAVDGVEAGTLDVVGADGASEPVSSPGQEVQPGFGAAATLGALLLTLLVVRRRTGRDG